MDDLLGFLCCMVALLSGLVLFFFGLACIWTAGPARWECEAVHQQTGLPTNFKFWSGCFVTMKNGETMYWADARKIITQEYKLHQD